MVPALLAPLAKGAAGLVGWQGAKNALPKLGSRLKGVGSNISGWLGRNTGRAGAGAGGVIGGLGLSETLDALGIEDSRLQKLSIIGLLIAVVFAVGQLFDIQVGGS